MSIDVVNDQERLANLSFEQLRELVGLVEYDGTSDPFPFIGWDAMVWVVGNATQSAHFFQSAFGMELIAYSGPSTGNRNHHAFVLKSGAVRFVIKGGVDPSSEFVEHHRKHGDGIVDISLAVPDVDMCIAHARAQGATVLTEPHNMTDAFGTVRIATIATYGDTRHTLVDRSAYTGPYLPGYVERTSVSPSVTGPQSGSSRHWITSWAMWSWARWIKWVDFYNRVMGFTNMAEFVGEDIATDYSALMSKVVASGNHRVKFPLNEPAIGKKRSQIDEYLEYYNGPGAQHVALATNDILAAVDTLRR